jgi:hypothetical protein
MKHHEFRGFPRDVGEGVGETFRGQIQKTLSENAQLQNKILPFHRTAEGGRKYQELLRLHDSRFPDYVSEIEGMSRGAGVPFEELFVANLWDVYEGFVPATDTSGCSTCSLVTAEQAVFGHNEDNLPIYRGQMYLAHFEIIGKPGFTALCYPGFLPGRALGFNSEGICFCANSVPVRGNVTGESRHFIARSIFEADSLGHAIRLAHGLERASGVSYTIGSTKKRRIVDLEVSLNEVRVSEITGVHFRANHYIRLTEVDQRISPSSRARQQRGEELLAHGAVRDKKGVIKVLRDGKVPDYPILRDGKSPDNGVTLATAVLDLDSKKVTIYPGAEKEKEAELEALTEVSIE